MKGRIEKHLAGLRVTIHPGAQPRPASEGLPFLGFIIFPGRRRLKRRKGLHFCRKLRGLVSEYEEGRLSLDRLTASIRGWVNHVQHANTTGLRKAVLSGMKLDSYIP